MSDHSQLALDYLYAQQLADKLIENQLQVAYLVSALLEDLQNGKTAVHACNILRDIKEIMIIDVSL